jgi:hypothetical protein
MSLKPEEVAGFLKWFGGVKNAWTAPIRFQRQFAKIAPDKESPSSHFRANENS